MNRLDRYIFFQLLSPFGVFTLIFAGILWITQTLRFIEIVVSNRQNAMVFLEFSVLTLPNVLAAVLVLSGTAAAIYLINRMIVESELSVLLASGVSYWRLAKPFLIYGAFVATLSFVVFAYFQPVSMTRLGDRVHSVQRNAFSVFIKERQFVHPARGLAIFVETASDAGAIEGLFLRDGRDPERPITYSARKALLVDTGEGLRLIMADGTMAAKTSDQSIDVIRFEELAYDIGEIVPGGNVRSRPPSEYFLGQLLNPDTIAPEDRKRPTAAYLAEGFQKLTIIAMALCLPFAAFAIMTFRLAPRRSAFPKGAAAFLLTFVGMVATEQFKSILVAGVPRIGLFVLIPIFIIALSVLLVASQSSGGTLRKIEAGT